MKESIEIQQVTLVHKFYVLFVLLFLTALPSSFLFAQEVVDIKSDTTLSDNLISYWPLDEDGGTRVDAHGDNDLEDYNGVFSSQGIFLNSALFKALEKQRMTILMDGGIKSGPMTWSVWVKINSAVPHGETYVFASVYDENLHVDYCVGYDNIAGVKHLIFQRALPGVTSHQVYYQYELGLGDWHNVVMTYDGLTIIAYFDGKKIGFVEASGVGSDIAGIDGFDNISLGSRAWADDHFSDASVDEVGIWDRALTVDEVERLYNGGLGLPYDANTVPVGASSVAFLPGITGSRLYRPEEDGGEDKLWESVLWGDIKELSFDTTGQSVRSDIYTRDIVDVIRPLTGLWDYAEGYEGWIHFLDSLTATDVIKQWKAIPYDWRLATNDIVKTGSEMSFDKISYLTGTQDIPYIIGQLEGLADGSPTGKVTVVAHSNGGLVIKNILRYLKEKNDTEMLAKIDTVVLVGVPQLGTPKTLGELLHGTISYAKVASREAMENMPGIYGLLPSKEFFSHAVSPVIEFDKHVANLPTYASLAGTKIDTYGGLRDFLTGVSTPRTAPDSNDLSTPNVLQGSLIDDASDMHTNVDTWEAPEGIRVIELVGTGLPTSKGILYSDCQKEHCPATNINFLSHEWSMSSEGDGTVLAISAEGGEADETYFIALDRYNAKTNYSLNHGTILSAPPVQEFIQDNVLGKGTSLPYLIGTDITKTSEYPRFEIRAYSPIDIHIYGDDTHTGVLEGGPEYEMGREYEHEVVNSYYEEWGDIAYVGADFSQGPLEIRIKGTATGVFTLAIDMFDGDTKTDSFVFRDVAVSPNSQGKIVLEEGEVPMLKYDIDGDGMYEKTILVEGCVLTLEEYLEKLKTKIDNTAFPKATKAWLTMRIALVEKLLEKKRIGNTRAAKVILYTILHTFDKRVVKNVSVSDLGELSAYVTKIIEFVQNR